jgi:hypothetical protein
VGAEGIYLTLDDVSVPQLPCIRSLEISSPGRDFHASAISRIISSLPNLELMSLELYAPRYKHQASQKEHRLGQSTSYSFTFTNIANLPQLKALATALESPSLRNLRTLNIYIDQDVPCNHNLTSKNLDPHYPAGDALKAAIRKLAETAPLARLHLTGWWLVSPALLNEDATFSFIKDIKIEASYITYDGR